MVDVTPGAQFTAPYPFKRDGKTLYEPDPEGHGSYEIQCWTPGTRIQLAYDGCGEHWADGTGSVRYTVVDTFRPGSWPTRVFYMREWIDPDGKVFGKDRLRVTTLGAFRRLCRGYRHNDVQFTGEQQEAA